MNKLMFKLEIIWIIIFLGIMIHRFYSNKSIFLVGFIFTTGITIFNLIINDLEEDMPEEDKTKSIQAICKEILNRLKK